MKKPVTRKFSGKKSCIHKQFNNDAFRKNIQKMRAGKKHICEEKMSERIYEEK